MIGDSNEREDLVRHLGDGWNRFWFTPRDPWGLCLIRVLTGIVALYWVISYSGDLVRWFGPEGLLPESTVNELTGASQRVAGGGTVRVFHWSYFYFLETPVELWIAHAGSILVVGLLTVGLFTRVTSILSLVVILSYIHRAPMISGPLEPVLAMTMTYLCIAPAGAALSVDAWMRARKSAGDASGSLDGQPSIDSVAANISWRLIQVHLAGFYVMMALNKLGGSEVWWTGQAVWQLIAKSETRLVDLTFMYPSEYLLNLWTHSIVLFELAFGVLIWNRVARPLLLIAAVPVWGSLALITGLTSYCAMMLIVNLAFVSPAVLRSTRPGRQDE